MNSKDVPIVKGEKQTAQCRATIVNDEYIIDCESKNIKGENDIAFTLMLRLFLNKQKKIHIVYCIHTTPCFIQGLWSNSALLKLPPKTAITRFSLFSSIPLICTCVCCTKNTENAHIRYQIKWGRPKIKNSNTEYQMHSRKH